MIGDSDPIKSPYKPAFRDPEKRMTRSLERLAMFADTSRIKSPEECKAALNKVNANLFFEAQYKLLLNYAMGKS